MKYSFQRALFGIFALFVISACSPLNLPVSPTLIYATSTPAATRVKTLPTSIPQGQTINYQSLHVAMTQAEITSAYVTEYGSRRDPTVGGRFLWIEVNIENTGSSHLKLPAPDHFSLLYGASEFKPAYGHRQNHSDYTILPSEIYPEQTVTGWLRFDIPASGQLQDFTFAYLPESSQVAFSFPEAAYSWADHPVFIWRCAP